MVLLSAIRTGLAEPIEAITAGRGPRYSSPVIADIDGNLANGKEIVVSSADGVISAVSATGAVLWDVTLPVESCVSLTTNNKIISSPAVGALNGDGVPYVVVGYGGIGGKECGGGVVALKGATGELAWTFDLKDFATRYPVFSVSHAVVSSPAIADFNNDRKLEVVFGALDRNIYVVSNLGKFKGFYHAADTVFSSPAIARADSDAFSEIIIGTDISKNTAIIPPTKNGGFLYALRGNLLKRRGQIPFRDANTVVWKRHFDQVVQSSPSVGELISSNRGLEVVVATGCYFPEGSTDKGGRYVSVVSLRTGRVLRTFAIPTCTSSEAAIADVDGDGSNDIVIPVQSLEQYGGTAESVVMAINPQSQRTLWTAIPLVGGSNSRELALFSGVVVADLDKNGSLEVVVTNASGFAVLEGATGNHLSCDERACSDGRQTFNGFRITRNSVAVGDLNNDGTLELVASGNAASGGLVQIYSNWSRLITSSPGTSTNPLPWPMFRGDSLHSANTSSF